MLITADRILIAIILLFQLVHVICFGIVHRDPIQCQHVRIRVEVNLLGKDGDGGLMAQRSICELVGMHVVCQLGECFGRCRVTAGIFVFLLKFVDVLQQILGGCVFLRMVLKVERLVVGQSRRLGLRNQTNLLMIHCVLTRQRVDDEILLCLELVE